MPLESPSWRLANGEPNNTCNMRGRIQRFWHIDSMIALRLFSKITPYIICNSKLHRSRSIFTVLPRYAGHEARTFRKTTSSSLGLAIWSKNNPEKLVGIIYIPGVEIHAWANLHNRDIVDRGCETLSRLGTPATLSQLTRLIPKTQIRASHVYNLHIN